MLSEADTNANRLIKTGVAQGDEKSPIRKPASKAPSAPRFVFFPTRFVEGIIEMTSQVWSASTTIKTPRAMYHHYEPPRSVPPSDIAIIPRIENVIAVPIANKME